MDVDNHVLMLDIHGGVWVSGIYGHGPVINTQKLPNITAEALADQPSTLDNRRYWTTKSARSY